MAENRQRVLNLYYELLDLVKDDNPISQLRLGRIIGMGQKGLLDDKSDEDIRYLLTSHDEEQMFKDEQRLGEIKTRQKEWQTIT